MQIVGLDNLIRVWLIVSRISALCFQRLRLIGLRVIHRRNECSSLRAMYYTSMLMDISGDSKSSDSSFQELAGNLVLGLCLRTRLPPSKACSWQQEMKPMCCSFRYGQSHVTCRSCIACLV